MQIQALKLIVTEADANRLAVEALRKGDVPVRNLKVSFTAEGVVVAGDYPTRFFSVPFETTWAPAVREGELHVRLAGIKVIGLPAGLFSGTLMSGLSDAAREPGLRVEGETLIINLDRFLEAKGLPLQANLKAVRCGPGEIVIEAGTAPRAGASG